jgi:hypothetical protein
LNGIESTVSEPLQTVSSEWDPTCHQIDIEIETSAFLDNVLEVVPEERLTTRDM